MGGKKIAKNYGFNNRYFLLMSIIVTGVTGNILNILCKVNTGAYSLFINRFCGMNSVFRVGKVSYYGDKRN